MKYVVNLKEFGAVKVFAGIVITDDTTLTLSELGELEPGAVDIDVNGADVPDVPAEPLEPLEPLEPEVPAEPFLPFAIQEIATGRVKKVPAPDLSVTPISYQVELLVIDVTFQEA